MVLITDKSLIRQVYLPEMTAISDSIIIALQAEKIRPRECLKGIPLPLKIQKRAETCKLDIFWNGNSGGRADLICHTEWDCVKNNFAGHNAYYCTFSNGF